MLLPFHADHSRRLRLAWENMILSLSLDVPLRTIHICFDISLFHMTFHSPLPYSFICSTKTLSFLFKSSRIFHQTAVYVCTMRLFIFSHYDQSTPNKDYR